jgi:hypothetical protein
MPFMPLLAISASLIVFSCSKRRMKLFSAVSFAFSSHMLSHNFEINHFVMMRTVYITAFQVHLFFEDSFENNQSSFTISAFDGWDTTNLLLSLMFDLFCLAN